jgi:colicin import membrane protein
MPRKLKTYQASVGFFDLAIAAPSMKAALEAWGSKSNLFHQGVAKESSDADVIAAAMSKPGIILKRPVGSNGAFKEHAHLPTHLSAGEVKSKPARQRPHGKKITSPQYRRQDRSEGGTRVREGAAPA